MSLLPIYNPFSRTGMPRLKFPVLSILFLFTGFFGVIRSGAQTSDLPILCGNEAFDYIIKNRYPELQQAFRATTDALQGKAVSDRSPVTIRVVVHVVWKNFVENLADSIIQNQIMVLNEDYNRENADTANLRPDFKPVAGNPQIRFELVDIVRVQTSATFKLDLTGGELLTNLKSSSQGGSDAWDPSAYLNIWVCKIQPITFGGITLGQILGFSFPPNNLGNWPADSGAPSPGQDGVVLDYRVVGRNNPYNVPIPGGTGDLVVRGRTGTHEVGHYLGLRHIWGDGGLLGSPNNCNQSDGIEDTPFANAQSTFDCDKTRNSCAKVEPFYSQDMPDLVENYMDYSSEDCMNMFTKGQADLMQSVLAGPRMGLLQAGAGTAQTTPEPLPRLYPNPVGRNGARLYVPAEWSAAAIELVAADGQNQLITTPVTGSGVTQVSIDTERLTPGWYAVRVQTPGRVWVERLIVLP